MDGAGKPVVALRESDGLRFNAYVQRWTGAAWQAVGGAVNAVIGRDIGGYTPALSLDGNGKPVVALQESDGTATNIYVRRSNQ